jgi:hypothetical protein
VWIDDKIGRWVGQIVGKEIPSKSNDTYLYVDFEKAIDHLNLNLSASQVKVFKIAENDCLYLNDDNVVELSAVKNRNLKNEMNIYNVKKLQK